MIITLRGKYGGGGAVFTYKWGGSWHFLVVAWKGWRVWLKACDCGRCIGRYR